MPQQYHCASRVATVMMDKRLATEVAAALDRLGSRCMTGPAMHAASRVCEPMSATPSQRVRFGFVNHGSGGRFLHHAVCSQARRSLAERWRQGNHHTRMEGRCHGLGRGRCC